MPLCHSLREAAPRAQQQGRVEDRRQRRQVHADRPHGEVPVSVIYLITSISIGTVFRSYGEELSEDSHASLKKFRVHCLSAKSAPRQ